MWVTVIESVDEAIASLARLFDEGMSEAEPAWLTEARGRWAEPAPAIGLSVVVPIWRDPWMVVGSGTYADDLLRRIGIDNRYGDPGAGGDAVGPDRVRPGGGERRYPRVTLDEIVASRPDVVVLPDEPYPFSSTDGPEAVAPIPAALVSGRALTWYGPAMVTAAAELLPSVLAASAGDGRP